MGSFCYYYYYYNINNIIINNKNIKTAIPITANVAPHAHLAEHAALVQGHELAQAHEDAAARRGGGAAAARGHAHVHVGRGARGEEVVDAAVEDGEEAVELREGQGQLAAGGARQKLLLVEAEEGGVHAGRQEADDLLGGGVEVGDEAAVAQVDVQEPVVAVRLDGRRGAGRGERYFDGRRLCQGEFARPFHQFVEFCVVLG